MSGELFRLQLSLFPVSHLLHPAPFVLIKPIKSSQAMAGTQAEFWDRQGSANQVQAEDDGQRHIVCLGTLGTRSGVNPWPQ